MMIGSAAVLPQ